MRPDAIIKTLEDAGFEARYVGGGVLDTLLDVAGRNVSRSNAAVGVFEVAKVARPAETVPAGLPGGETRPSDEVLAALEGYRGRSDVFDEGLNELTTVVKYLAAFGVPQENFAVDLTIARGLDYYTGTVYETLLLDHPELGSVCSGGRYDNLAGYYIEKQLPGVGISIGLTRLFYVLGEQGMLNPELPTAPADVLILPMTEDLSPAIALATQLRQAGIRTQLHCEQKKFKAKMSYADKLSIPYVIFLGEDEINAGVVACKDMKSGEQTKLNTQETIDRIKAGLAELEKGSVIVE